MRVLLRRGMSLPGRLNQYYLLISPVHISNPSYWKAGIFESDDPCRVLKGFVTITVGRPEILNKTRSELAKLVGCSSIQQRIHDVHKLDCIVLEHMPGDLLFESRTKKFEQREIKTIAKSVLQGLKFAHEKGIVHTNLSPKSILIQRPPGSKIESGDESLLAKIAGWALASQPSAHQISYRPFRAPESWLGLPWNSKADIWSFGVIIATLCLGHGLFHSSRNELGIALEILHSHISNFGPYPEHMTHQAGKDSLLPGLFAHLNTWKRKPYVTDEQVKDWRYHVQQGLVLEEDSAFVERVLKIDPEERPSAATLLEDEWLKDV